MYNTGDLIVYGNMGVCRIADISVREDAAGGQRAYYVLEPLYQKCTVTTPVDNAKVPLRPVISREEAEQLIDEIPNINADEYPTGAVRQLTEYYEGVLKTNDCMKLLELTMCIYSKKCCMEAQKRKFGLIDEKYMKRAEELLLGELAAVMDMTREQVREYIEQRVGAPA